ARNAFQVGHNVNPHDHASANMLSFRTKRALNDDLFINEIGFLISNCQLNLPEWQYVVQRECAGRWPIG
ncbi:hypothetical protein KJ965_05490, partial [Patescibacteria group bacterium]|nr:hypothetical protein [Patescibacteria group bacterium]